MVKSKGETAVEWNQKVRLGTYVWRKAVIISLYEGKRNESNCKNYSEISIISIASRV